MGTEGDSPKPATPSGEGAATDDEVAHWVSARGNDPAADAAAATSRSHAFTRRVIRRRFRRSGWASVASGARASRNSVWIRRSSARSRFRVEEALVLVAFTYVGVKMGVPDQPISNPACHPPHPPQNSKENLNGKKAYIPHWDPVTGRARAVRAEAGSRPV